MVRHGTAHKHLHRKQQKTAFDYFVYFFVIATPLFELPQAYDIFHNRSAENVSLFTWVFFFAASIIWLIYAARNKLLPLVIAYALYILIEGIIVIGILLYR